MHTVLVNLNVRKIVWSEHARTDRDRRSDVKKLKGEPSELRLRLGDYRVRFTEEPGDILHLFRRPWQGRLLLTRGSGPASRTSKITAE